MNIETIKSVYFVGAGGASTDTLLLPSESKYQ